MPVPVQTPTASTTANGVSVTFPYAFTVLDAADLTVTGTLAGAIVTYTLGVDYSVIGVGTDAGAALFVTPPANGTVITTYRDSALKRDTDYQDGGDLLAATVDMDFDRLWLVLQELVNGGKVSARALRVPSGETVSEFPSAVARALRLVGFDALGNTTLNTPSAQSASALALLLASYALNTQGAGMVGHNSALTYPPNTVGNALANVSAGRVYYASKVGGFTSGGVVDNIAAFTAAKALLPEGSTLVLDNLYGISTKLVWDKRVSIICAGFDCGLYLNTSSATDGFELIGTTLGLLNGINGMRIDLNVYGPAACCQRAVVLSRLDRSDVKLNIRAGALAYGLWVRGAIINTWNIQSSANYSPPIALPFGTQANHMLVDNYGVAQVNKGVVAVSNASPAVVTLAAHGFPDPGATGIFTPVVFTTTPPAPFVKDKPYFVIAAGWTLNSFELSDTAGGAAINTSASGAPTLATCSPVASNTNKFYVNFEGATNGCVQTDMPTEGSNELFGEMEGLAGRPFQIGSGVSFSIPKLKMEANALDSTVTGMLAFEADVSYFGGVGYSNRIVLSNVHSYELRGYGEYTTDSNCFAGEVGPWMSPHIDSNVNGDVTLVQTSSMPNSDNANSMGGGPGAPTMANLYVNPGFDIYDAVATTVGPPVGVTGAAYVAGDYVLETGVVYTRSAIKTALKCLSRGTTITNGPIFTCDPQPWAGNEWVSILVPVYMLSSGTRVFAYFEDGGPFRLIGSTKGSGAYEEIRGSFKPTPGSTWRIRLAITNPAGSAYLNGWNFYVGGLHVCKGALPPATIEDSLARNQYLHTSVTFTPHRKLADAFVAGVGYRSYGTASAADWKQVT